MSRLYQERFPKEMEPAAPRCCSLIEIRCYRLGDLVLQVAQVLPLRSDATAIGRIPGGYQPARFLVVLDLQRNFVHHSNPSLPAKFGQVAVWAGRQDC